LHDASRRLDTDNHTSLARFVSVAEAELILSRMAGRDENYTANEAAIEARKLTGLYPAREVGDAKAYAAGMTAVLAAHPIDFVRRVCDPVKGLPSRLKWLPTIADVTEAINAECQRRDRIGANARYVIAEHERLERKAKEDAEWEKSRPAAEDRAKQVLELLKVKPVSSSETKAA
jgi:hypothetical protein